MHGRGVGLACRAIGHQPLGQRVAPGPAQLENAGRIAPDTLDDQPPAQQVDIDIVVVRPALAAPVMAQTRGVTPRQGRRRGLVDTVAHAAAAASSIRARLTRKVIQAIRPARILPASAPIAIEVIVPYHTPSATQGK